MKKLLLLICLCCGLAACSSTSQLLDPEELLSPPRAATQTAQAEIVSSVEPMPTQPPAQNDAAPLERPNPETTPLVPIVEVREPLTIWLNETSDAHQAFAETVAADFEAKTGIPVVFLFVEAEDVAALARTAALTDQLPDVIFHQLEFSVGMVQQGILDPSAAAEVVNGLGRDSFQTNALEMVEFSADNQISAIPSDGWQHILLYRADWFAQAQLPSPTTFDNILNNSSVFYNLNNENLPEGTPLRSGIVVPTEADLQSTQRVLEHFALANRCELADSAGEILLLNPACLEVLDFYRSLIFQYSPPDYQTDITAIKAFVDGRTAMIMTTPATLPFLANTNATYAPTCIECAENPTYLTQNSGMVTALSGNNPANGQFSFVHGNYLGITTAAERSEAIQFANYWFEDGYAQWLAIEPERKTPLRLRDSAGNSIVAQWQAMPMSGSTAALDEVFPAQNGVLVSEVLLGAFSAENTKRWGTDSQQGAILGSIYDQLLIAPIVQRMLSGYITSAQAILEIYQAVVETIPNYQFFPTPVPAEG